MKKEVKEITLEFLLIFRQHGTFAVKEKGDISEVGRTGLYWIVSRKPLRIMMSR